MEISGEAVTARGIGVRGPRGPVFENVDLDVSAGGLLVVHGPGGSGRTSLLLALAGRMRLHTGAVEVGRHRCPGRGARHVRRLVALARADGAVDLEGRLRTSEVIAERCWLERDVTPRRVVEAARRVGLRLRPESLVEDLGPLDALLLAVALALAARPPVLVVDSLDRDCPAEDREHAWQALEAVRACGCTVLAAATDPPAAPADGAALLALPRRHTGRPTAPTAAKETAA
ncbi:ATP-binding cassette domain-containing protein [Streptomyces sp. SP17BM10]|uniref:ATP-binding cassette domain-containing protein n=1 Tax=Streptomyces sp. SP17BM10 TaxID=3002530 RepID=UPI002E7936F5|nr:ATP-binding cassette domain-containing protein [Streptomyces sp. SP17BM10]MEE1783788.1 ATP-binding cassette domain-containing protein [Streptomyces sp. SP17BM10]